jgi:hypothetical protein
MHESKNIINQINPIYFLHDYIPNLIQICDTMIYFYFDFQIFQHVQIILLQGYGPKVARFPTPPKKNHISVIDL